MQAESDLAEASEARDQLSAALHVKNEQEKALRADLAAANARAERAETLTVTQIEQRLRALLGRQGEDDCSDMRIEWVAIYAELWADGNPHFASCGGIEDDTDIALEACVHRGTSIAEVLAKMERAVAQVEARQAELDAEEDA
jgi:hypothetical protein